MSAANGAAAQSAEDILTRLDAAAVLADLHPGGDDQEGSGGKKSSQASQLVTLARARYEVFMSTDGRPYAVKLDGPNLAIPLRGKAGVRSQLARIYTDDTGGTVPSQSALADAMTVLEGIAASAEPRPLHLRTARHEDTVVVDLGTPEGRCVIIGAQGWQREPRSPVLFRRSGAMKPLPEPIRDGDGLERLRGLLNLDDEGFHLLTGWLVAAFIPDIPHPILMFTGEQGTGKSSATRAVIGLVDPSGATERSQPRDVKAWAVQAFNSWALCLDNVSAIPPWLSDALCRAVTGDGLVERALYSDDDVVVLAFRRVLGMSSIDPGSLRGDLAERLLPIELQLIPKSRRRKEADINTAFADTHPAILASLFDLVADVLKALPEVKLTELPRMADFAEVLAALDAVTGWHTLDAYTAGAQLIVADVIESDPFASAIVAFLTGRPHWRGTAGALLTELDTQRTDPADPDAKPAKPPKGWPTGPRAVSGALKRIAPALREIGIDYTPGERTNEGRHHELTQVEGRRTQPSQPSPDTENPAPTSENNRDGRAKATVTQPSHHPPTVTPPNAKNEPP